MDTPVIVDNQKNSVVELLKTCIHKNDELDIATDKFSLFAFDELKDKLIKEPLNNYQYH